MQEDNFPDPGTGTIPGSINSQLTEQIIDLKKRLSDLEAENARLKQAEYALRESEMQFRNVWEYSFDGMRLIDSGGIIRLVNEAFCKMVDKPKEELEGRLFTDIYKSEQDEKLLKAIRRISSGSIVPRYEEEFILWNGWHRWFEVSNNLLEMDGNPRLLLSIFRDITDRKKVEEKLTQTISKLEASNKELEQFAYVASHDLQEPLRMISSYTQLLAKKYQEQLDETAREFINYAVDGSIRMQTLIKDLLAYSRITTKARAFEMVDCNDILDEVLDDLKISIEENKATIKTGHLPVISADPTQFRQLLQNLLSNALKFRTAKNPEIEIKTERGTNEWIFSITDNGIGIDPQYFSRIFLLFQRLHDRDSYPGTGIGLAICKKIVERHGGRIWLESEADRGTAFYFTMPDRLI
ncbi:MAG: sensor histidine kinase [Ignavibacteriales bacterium]